MSCSFVIFHVVLYIYNYRINTKVFELVFRFLFQQHVMEKHRHPSVQLVTDNLPTSK